MTKTVNISLSREWAQTAVRVAKQIEKDYKYEFSALSSNARSDINYFIGYIKSLEVLLK